MSKCNVINGTLTTLMCSILYISLLIRKWAVVAYHYFFDHIVCLRFDLSGKYSSEAMREELEEKRRVQVCSFGNSIGSLL